MVILAPLRADEPTPPGLSLTCHLDRGRYPATVAM